MHLKDGYSLGKLVDKKKYSEVDIEFDPSSRSRRGSIKKDPQILLQGSHSNMSKFTAHNNSSTHSLNKANYHNHTQSKQLISNLSRSNLNESMTSLLGNRSSLPSITTDFYLNRYKVLDKKLDKSELDNMLSIDAPSTAYVNLETLMKSEYEKEAKLNKPVRQILPNSNISLVCLKGTRIYYQIPYRGYRFPVKFNYHKKILVSTLISFKHKRPDEIKNEEEHFGHEFEIKKAILDFDDPDSTADNCIYICIIPLCDFSTTLSVSFESKDFKQVVDFKHPKGGRDFQINYKEFTNFSDQFVYNVRSVAVFKKKPQPSKKIEFHKALLKDYAMKKQEELQKFRDLDQHRIQEAKAKSKQIEHDRVENILERKREREGGIIFKRMVTERVLSKVFRKTCQRNMLIHIKLFQVFESIKAMYDKRVAEKHHMEAKFHANNLIVKYLLKAKKKFKQEPILLPMVKGKPNEFFEIKVSTGELLRYGLNCTSQVLAKHSREQAHRAMVRFAIASSVPMQFRERTLEFRRRIVRIQRNYRKMTAHRKIFVKIFAPVFEDAVDKLDSLGRHLQRKGMMIKSAPHNLNIPEVIKYIYDYQVYKEMLDRYSGSKKGYNDFPTVLKKLKDSELFQHVEYQSQHRTTIKETYPDFQDSKLQDSLKEELSADEPMMISLKNRVRDETVQKLRSILTKCRQVLEGGPKFKFELGNIEILLFWISFYDLRSDLQLNIFDAVFSTAFK